jgi:hypothetical protein
MLAAIIAVPLFFMGAICCQTFAVETNVVPSSKLDIASTFNQIGEVRRTNRRSRMELNSFFPVRLGEPLSDYLTMCEVAGAKRKYGFINNKHHFYCQIMYDNLKRFSSGFFRGDYVVLQFTTDSNKEDSIIDSFKRLFGKSDLRDSVCA